MKIQGFLILSVLIILSGACSKSNIATDSEQSYMTVAEERYGKENTECQENKDKTYVLCKHQINEPGSPFKAWEFFVYDMNNGKISFDDTLDKGNVKWFSDTELEISKVPGIMADGQTMNDYAWIVNVVSGLKIKKTEYLKKEDR